MNPGSSVGRPSAAVQYASTPYGYYRRIGGAFRAGTVKWGGPVVAGPEAFYLLKVERHSDAAAAGAAAGGLVGALVAGAISAALQKPDENPTCTYFQLPESVRGHPDWPIKKRKKDVEVLVLPRDSVESIRHPRFSNVIKLKADGVDYSIEYTFFTGNKVKNFLAASGWKLEW
jgi:hypothetical protein